MKFECERARSYFKQALEHLSEEDKPLFLAAQIMEAIYFRLLQDIERAEYNVFAKRIRLINLTKLLITIEVWWKNRTLRSHAVSNKVVIPMLSSSAAASAD